MSKVFQFLKAEPMFALLVSLGASLVFLLVFLGCYVLPHQYEAMTKCYEKTPLEHRYLCQDVVYADMIAGGSDE